MVSHQPSPASFGLHLPPLLSLSLQFLRGPHIWFLSWLLLLLFPIDLSHRSAASSFFSLFPSLSELCVSRLSGSPEISLPLWLVFSLFSLFRNIMTWWTSHAVSQNHFLLALSLIFLALYYFLAFSLSIFYISPLCQSVWKNTAASSILVCVQHRKTGSVMQEWHTPVMFRKTDTHSGWFSSDVAHFLCEHKRMLPITT